MNHLTDAYVTTLVPQAGHRAFCADDHGFSVVVTHDALHQCPSILAGNSVSAIERLVKGIVSALRTWHERRSAIHELRALDDDTLKDIGLHRSQIPSVVEGLLNVRPELSVSPEATNIQ